MILKAHEEFVPFDMTHDFHTLKKSLAPEESRRYTRLMPTAPDDDDDALAVASARSRPPDALVPSTCPPRKEAHVTAARSGALLLWPY